MIFVFSKKHIFTLRISAESRQIFAIVSDRSFGLPFKAKNLGPNASFLRNLLYKILQ